MSEKATKTPQIRFDGYTDAWEERKLGEIFNYEQPTKYIVKSTEYDDNFNTPVLTAGKSFLLGYTDETSGIKNATVENPVVIFDDFTTGSHYVDFPFKIKSSAMKLLSLNDNSDNFYFMFNTLKNIKYVPQSHERHWISKFSSFVIYKPSQEEQQKIGSFFKQLDDTIALHQRKCDLLAKMKKSYLQKMFPKNGEDKPEIRFDGYTDAWEQRKLKELGDIQTGNTPSTSNADNYSIDGMLWVTPTDIKSLVISDTSKKLSEAGVLKARIAKAGSILVTSIASIGKNTLVTKDVGFNQQINALTPTNNNDSYFLLTQSEKWSAKMKQTAAAATMQIVNKTDFSNISTFVPVRKDEQKKIGTFFKQLDDLITLHQRELDSLKKMKKSLLQMMFV